MEWVGGLRAEACSRVDTGIGIQMDDVAVALGEQLGPTLSLQSTSKAPPILFDFQFVNVNAQIGLQIQKIS